MKKCGRRIVQLIPELCSSASERACSRPFLVGASYPAPTADIRTTCSIPAFRAAVTAFMLACGAAGPIAVNSQRTSTPANAPTRDDGSSRSPT